MIFKKIKKFPETIKDEWGIKGCHKTAVLIPFMHYLTKNDAEILTLLKWQTLPQKEDLQKKTEKIKDDAAKAIASMGKLRNDYYGGDHSMTDKLGKISSNLDKVSDTANKMFKMLQTALSSYSTFHIKAIKRHALFLSTAENRCQDLISAMKNDQNLNDSFLETAKVLEKAIKGISTGAEKLHTRIEEFEKLIDQNIDFYLKFTTPILQTNKKKRIFIIHLFSQFLGFILDENRLKHKDECSNLYNLLTKDPGLEALLTKVYLVGRPNRFQYRPTTGTEYEKFIHVTTEPRPKNVLEFEKKIKKTWHCYKNGYFHLDDNIEIGIDDSVIDFVNRYIDRCQEEKYNVDYFYLSPDLKLMFTCKTQEEKPPLMTVDECMKPTLDISTSRPKSVVRYFFELTFRSDPSSLKLKRSLQKKKVMADYLWNGGDSQQHTIPDSPALSYDQAIKDAVAMYDKYGISLSLDFFRNQLFDILVKRLRSDAFMPVIDQYTKNLTKNFNALFKSLAAHEENKVSVNTRKKLMDALGDFPASAADTYDRSLLDWKLLYSDIETNIKVDIKTTLEKYAFMTQEETDLKDKIENDLEKAAKEVLEALDFESLKSSFQRNMAPQTSDFIKSTLKKSNPSKLQEYKKWVEETLQKSYTLLNKILAPANMHDHIDDILAHDISLDEKETFLLNTVLLRSHLKNALSAQPEKLLERYDFLTSMDDWREKTASNIMWMVLGANTIDQIIKKNETVLKAVLTENEEIRRTIESTIRKTWSIGNGNEEDLTSVFTAITNYMAKGNLDHLYSIRKSFVNPEAEYFPVPLLIYEEKAPKKWKDYNEDNHSLAEAFAEHAESFLRQTKKYSGQRTELDKLLNGKEQERIEFLWGDGTKYDTIITDALSKIGEAGFRVPEGLDLNFVRQNLKNFFCKDTISFLSNYDFSVELAKWVKQKVTYFVEGFPRIQCILNDNNNMDKLIDEYKVNLHFMHKKYEIYDDKHIDTQFSTQGFTHSKRGEQTLTVKDHNQDFAIPLSIDEMKILRNFRYESSLKSYLMHADEYQSKNKLRDKIRERNRINKKPTKKKQKELAKADKLNRGKEALKLLIILKLEDMRSYFSEGSNDESYLLKLNIYEMVYSKEMSKKEIIDSLVDLYKELIKNFKNKDSLAEDYRKYLEKNYDKLKQRSKELIKNAQNKINLLLQKIRKREVLSEQEKTILREYWGDYSIEKEVKREFTDMSSTSESFFSRQSISTQSDTPISSDDTDYN